jgi:hypothetical protein
MENGVHSAIYRTLYTNSTEQASLLRELLVALLIEALRDFHGIRNSISIFREIAHRMQINVVKTCGLISLRPPQYCSPIYV